MKLRKFKKRYWITVISAILVYYLFAIGPLFPWNPFKSGYKEFKSANYSVYFLEDSPLPESYKNLDTFILNTSTQFDLPLERNIKIIRTDKQSLKGYLPWLKTDGLGGAALQTGDVLYINAQKIAEMGYSEDEYAKHELMHLLQYQHANIFNAHSAGKVVYLSEGISFYVGGPKFYSRAELLERLKKVKLEETTQGNEIYAADTFSNLDKDSAEGYKVSHMLYGEFIKYLIDTYGQEKFNTFNHEFLNTPSLHRQLFEEIYGKKLEVDLQKFEEVLVK